MDKATVFTVGVALALVTSCGDSAHPGKVSVAPQTVHHDVASIRAAIGAESKDGGHTYLVEVGDPLGSCPFTAVLPDAAQVADAVRKGERVATNAAQTIGLITTSGACVKELSRAVRDVS
jgi:hypothetical protein